MKFKFAIFSIIFITFQNARATVHELILSLSKSTSNEQIIDTARDLSRINDSVVEYELDSKTISVAFPDDGNQSKTSEILKKMRSLKIESVPVDKIMLGTQDDQK